MCKKILKQLFDAAREPEEEDQELLSLIARIIAEYILHEDNEKS